MVKKRSEILLDEVFEQQRSLVLDRLKVAVVWQLARTARSYMKVSTHVRITGYFHRLGDATYYKLMTYGSAIARDVASRLASAKSPFRQALDELLTGNGLGPSKAQKLTDGLSSRILELMETSEYDNLLASVSSIQIYRALAEFISGELYTKVSAGTLIDEAVALNLAILSYHFERWHTPAAELVRHFRDFNDCKIGMRGYLISITEIHGPAQKRSMRAAIPRFAPLHSVNCLCVVSDLFAAVSSESLNINRGNGFFHRIIPVDSPVDFHGLPRGNGVDQKFVEAGRRLLYPQYEHTALIFMALAGIEFVARSCVPGNVGERESVETIIGGWVGLPDDVKANVISLFSARSLNARNRCMHGAFLEIEGRRADLTRASGLLSRRGIPRIDLSDDDSLPANLSAIVISALSSLAAYVEGASAHINTIWCSSLLLTSAELQKAREIKRDMLVDPDSCEVWRKAISKHLEEMSPALSIPIKMGILAWSARENKEDSMPKIYFLSLLFEPLLRLTLHAHGRSVMQQTLSSDGRDGFLSIRYKMLDENGLLTVDNVRWITSHLAPAEAEAAAEVLRLAVKCRNALAHGAVYSLSDDIRDNYSHTIIKAIQLIVERTVGSGASQRV